MKVRSQKQTATTDINSLPKDSTLNISELSPHEKRKYLEFLISKNINFQEDKDGNMLVAKIRVKGPQQPASIANKENTLPIVRETTRQSKKNFHVPCTNNFAFAFSKFELDGGGGRSKTPSGSFDPLIFAGNVGPFVENSPGTPLVIQFLLVILDKEYRDQQMLEA
jgi:hypothetical protein